MSHSRLLDRHLNNNICPDLKKGDRIVLIRMSDPISPIAPKSRGTVLKDGINFVDETIYSIRWDKSGSLNILSNIDGLKTLDGKINKLESLLDQNLSSEKKLEIVKKFLPNFYKRFDQSKINDVINELISNFKTEIKKIESDHDVWMFEEDFDNLKNKVKSITESSKNVVDILKKSKDKFKNYEVSKLIKYLTAVRDASFINMREASFFLICGKERTEDETKYTNKTNKKAYQYVLDNAGEVRDIMIRGAMKSLEETNKEITPESVERLMRRDAQQFLLLYMTLPIKQQDYLEYDYIKDDEDDKDDEDYNEDGYEDEEDDY